MEDPFLGEVDEERIKNPKVHFPIGLVIASIVVIIIGIIVATGNNAFIKNAEVAKANLYYKEVRSISEEDKNKFEVYAKYNVNGKEYYEHLKDMEASGLALLGVRDGKEANIYYNPDNPREIKDNASKFTGIIIIAFGTLLFALLMSGHAYSVKKRNEYTENMKEINKDSK